MRLSVCSLVFLGASLVLNSSAFAQAQSGMFMIVKGDVKVKSVGKSAVAAKVGSKVSVGDVIETGKDSRAKITMIDRNVIQILPDSKLEISKYLTDAKKGTKDIEISLEKGKVRNEVNDVYDGEKTKFQLKTPTAVAGVRGTQFVTSYDVKTRKTDIVTLQGKVNFTSISNGKIVGSVDVKVGETASATAGAAPEPPRPIPANELKSIETETTAANNPPPKSAGDVANNKSPDQKDGEKGPEKSPDRAPASEAQAPPPRMDPPPFDPKGDLPPAANLPGSNVNQPLPPRVPTVPTTNPIVRDIVRDGAGKTKVIVKPQY